MNTEINQVYLYYFLYDELYGVFTGKHSDEGRSDYRRIPLAGKAALSPIKKQVGYRVHPDLADLFEQAAAQDGVSRNAWVTKTLVSELRRRGIAVPDELGADAEDEQEAQVSVSMAAPDQLRSEMDAAAARSGLSRNAWLVMTLQSALRQPHGALAPRVTRKENFRPMNLYVSPTLRDAVDAAATSYGVPRNRWLLAAIEWSLAPPPPHLMPLEH